MITIFLNLIILITNFELIRGNLQAYNDCLNIKCEGNIASYLNLIENESEKFVEQQAHDSTITCMNNEICGQNFINYESIYPNLNQDFDLSFIKQQDQCYEDCKPTIESLKEKFSCTFECMYISLGQSSYQEDKSPSLHPEQKVGIYENDNSDYEQVLLIIIISLSTLIILIFIFAVYISLKYKKQQKKILQQKVNYEQKRNSDSEKFIQKIKEESSMGNSNNSNQEKQNTSIVQCQSQKMQCQVTNDQLLIQMQYFYQFQQTLINNDQYRYNNNSNFPSYDHFISQFEQFKKQYPEYLSLIYKNFLETNEPQSTNNRFQIIENKQINYNNNMEKEPTRDNFYNIQNISTPSDNSDQNNNNSNKYINNNNQQNIAYKPSCFKQAESEDIVQQQISLQVQQQQQAEYYKNSMGIKRIESENFILPEASVNDRSKFQIIKTSFFQQQAEQQQQNPDQIVYLQSEVIRRCTSQKGTFKKDDTVEEEIEVNSTEMVKNDSEFQQQGGVSDLVVGSENLSASVRKTSNTVFSNFSTLNALKCEKKGSSTQEFCTSHMEGST